MSPPTPHGFPDVSPGPVWVSVAAFAHAECTASCLWV